MTVKNHADIEGLQEYEMTELIYTMDTYSRQWFSGTS